MITENLSTLKIHKLTKEQYDREFNAGRIDENAIYLTPDDDIINDEEVSSDKTWSSQKIDEHVLLRRRYVS